MDGCFSLGVGSLTPPSGHCSRPLGAAGGSPPYQCTRASGGPPSHFGLQPVVLSPRRVTGLLSHRQRDCSVRSHALPHSLSAVARGTEKSVARLDRTAGVSPSAPHSHHPQCGSGRSQPPRTSQYRVDAASRGLLSDSSLGRSSSGGPPGLANQLPSAAVGVSLPSPGCSGLQLSQYRLERLRQHLCVPSGRSAPDSAATHPRLQRSPHPGGSMGPSGSLVALSPPAGLRSPPSADDPVSVLRPRPGLPQVGDLRSLDRLSFLRRALLASRPAAVVDTLLASYRPSSQRQQEVAWTAFRLVTSGPLDGHQRRRPCLPAVLFSSRSLAPTTILNYRAALQWPLEEAFSVNFSHPDFSRFATGLFHLRLLFHNGTCRPLYNTMNRWILTPAPSDFYSCKRCVSQPWPRGIGVRSWPTSPVGPLWTRALLLRCPSSHVFYLKTRRLLAALPYFLSYFSQFFCLPC